MTYTQHPLSAAFPAMSPDEFVSLKDSISNLGVQNAITLYEGQVLDGWNRYSAANELQMECPTQDLPSWMDPVDFVKAQNKHRRHLSQGAWALVEVVLHDWKPAHRPINSAPGADLSKTTKEIAASAGVSERTVEQAKVVAAKATPEVKEAVLTGKTSVKKAEKIAKLPAQEQAKALADATAPKPRIDPEPLPEVEDEDAPSAEELEFALQSEAADRELLNKLMESDDKLATAVAEAKRLSLELLTVKASRDGLMNQNAELIRTIKSLQRRLDRVERAPA